MRSKKKYRNLRSLINYLAGFSPDKQGAIKLIMRANIKTNLTIPLDVYEVLKIQAEEQGVCVNDRIREILCENLGVTKQQIWDRERKEKLKELYGTMDATKICKKLRINHSEFRRITKELELGFQKDYDEYITQKQLCDIMGIRYYTVQKFRRHGLPVKEMRFGPSNSKRYNVMIKLTELIKWLEEHQNMFEAIKIKHMALGYEPEWLREKRREEFDEKSKERSK